MNYRHAYHAGNFGDVLKHAVLASILTYLKRKPQPFRVIDVHAGIGRYDLTGVEAGKTGEWQGGIGRLIGSDAAPLPDGIEAILAPYLDGVRALNGPGRIDVYPGSPLVARLLMRPDDRLVVNELHPADRAALEAELGRDRAVKVMSLDAWIAVKALLPPPERRGVVLIDPPYEQPDELAKAITAIDEAMARFATGIVLLWYPIKASSEHRAVHQAIGARKSLKALVAEVTVRPDVEARGLNGSGLAVINPPWTLRTELEALLPFLAQRLAQRPGGGYSLTATGGA
ncbi:MAG: 23S rRNA (adenine(2030)-N(6))-methyltransferase RlmJ [Hyphomicrobiaceae bacterium]